MDEQEFNRLLDLFPVVRTRSYRAGSESVPESTSHSSQSEVTDFKDARNGMDNDSVGGTPGGDAFWQKLRSAATAKVGPEKAERFCKAFQRVQTELVHKGLSPDAAQRFINRGN
ncbi:hypothetical protein IHE45_12G048800 [Dioscorea alata]|uniref:Uncharacterized protein n=1 Tax=Dioscorea alata TaxID=55571 RepID=A0ACB7V1S4_DIOAL|nr:hypothetical protein IHE45_12G048800 [Dioscorea alata]